LTVERQQLQLPLLFTFGGFERISQIPRNGRGARGGQRLCKTLNPLFGVEQHSLIRSIRQM